MSKPHSQTCPVAAFLNLFGDAWTWMIVREAFYGASRFSEFRRNTGIARNILSDRLSTLVGAGILERRDVGETGTRFAYRLTDKGRSLLPVLLAIVQWGNEQLYGPDQAPVLLFDRTRGEALARIVPLSRDGKPLGWEEIAVRPGPGASRAARVRLAHSEVRLNHAE